MHSIRIVAAVISVGAFAGLASASRMGLDEAFGYGDGKARVDITPQSNGGSAMVQLPDRRLVMAGSCVGASNYDFCVVRFSSAGLVDTTFNGTGSVVTPVGSGQDIANSVAVQSDGKLLVAGRCDVGGPTGGQSFCTVRYTESGQLDTTFGNGGKVLTQIGDGVQEEVTGIVVQPSGRIIVSGYCADAGTRAFCLAAYNSDGTLNEFFNASAPVGARGRVKLRPGGDSLAWGVTPQPDNKIVVVGQCATGLEAPRFCAARLSPDGDIDATFGGTGFYVGPAWAADSAAANAVAVRNGGGLVLVGTCSNAPGQIMCFQFLKADGTLDQSIGGSGVMGIGILSTAATSVMVQRDGRIVIAGSIIVDVDRDFYAVRLNADGSADGTFNRDGGIVTKVTSGNDNARSIAIDIDGALMLGGSCGQTGYSFCAVRYSIPCTMDMDGDGSVLATTDGLIYARIALGMTGAAVTNGIVFPSIATRKTWFAIRNHLVGQCGMSLP